MIDFQGLLAVMTATENNPDVKMSCWLDPAACGTTACMIGSFCLANPEDKLTIRDSHGDIYPILHGSTPRFSIANRFGITIHEANWLFTDVNKAFSDDWVPAVGLSKEQALVRLRKFIYYKLHKQEMIVEVGRNRALHHTGRNISGRSSAVLAGS